MSSLASIKLRCCVQETIDYPTGLAPEAAISRKVVSPFLRWAGGKRWLVPQLRELLGDVIIGDYYEPFLGGASVFLALPVTGMAHLADLNADLIEVYEEVRDDPASIAAMVSSYRNTAEDYYSARASSPAGPQERAARFIYLNHTSFNGIFRVNLKGEYNVPYGHRKSPSFPDTAALTQVSGRLQSATLTSADFETSLQSAGTGDLIFLDPPYTVAHNNNGFVKYNQHLFSFEDQERLARTIGSAVERGADFILTNAAHSSIDELFSPLGHRVTVNRRNVIGGSNAGRGRAEEYLFTSIGAK